jgi:phosphopantothenate synthetase
MAFELPERGFVFWPVGTGDSSTVVLDSGKTVVQIDLHELECCDDRE